MTANTEIEGLVARLEKAHRATAGEENRRTIREAAEALAALEARVGELERQVKEANGWTLEMSIYEGFSTEIWADGREPGQRTVAIVRDYRDAVFILAAIARATQAEAARSEAAHLMSDYARKYGELKGRYDAAHWPGIVDEWQARATQAEARVAELEKTRDIFKRSEASWMFQARAAEGRLAEAVAVIRDLGSLLDFREPVTTPAIIEFTDPTAINDAFARTAAFLASLTPEAHPLTERGEG